MIMEYLKISYGERDCFNYERSSEQFPVPRYHQKISVNAGPEKDSTHFTVAMCAFKKGKKDNDAEYA